MKAAVLHGPGEVPEYTDFDDPPVTEGRELVEMIAAGIHPVVRSIASGRHYGSTGSWPLIPGVDGVARTAGGTLVYTGFVQPPYGTLAERAVVPASRQLPLPAGVAPERVAAGMNPGMSSWLPLRQRLTEISALGTVLILGATGMAGLLAVQNALALGADRVVAAGRNPDALDRAAGFGATVAILREDRDATAAALAEALAGQEPSLVLDFVWGPHAEAAFLAAAQPPHPHLRQRRRVGLAVVDRDRDARVPAVDRGRPGGRANPGLPAVRGQGRVAGIHGQREPRSSRSRLLISPSGLVAAR